MEGMTLTISIILITCLVSFTTFNKPDKIDDLSMWPYMVKERKQFYRFFTSGFVHADFLHLGFNMFTLYFSGRIIEDIFMQLFNSKAYYLVFYFAAIALADVPTYFRHRNDYNYRTIGASGAVSAMIYATVLFAPWAMIRVFFIPMPLIVYAVLYLFLSAYLSRRDPHSGINHSAHLWGAVFGLIFPLVFKPEIFLYFLSQLLHPQLNF